MRNLDIQRVIDEFRAPWTPAGDELTLSRILIDPAGGGSGAGPRRESDDLALLTGACLEQLVEVAGGKPTLTRADDRAWRFRGADRTAALRELCTQQRAAVLIRIECEPEARDVAVTPLGGHELASVLAKRIGQDLEVKKTGETEGDEGGLPCAGVRIVLPLDENATRGDRSVPAHVEWSERICQGLSRFAQAEHSRLNAALAGGKEKPAASNAATCQQPFFQEAEDGVTRAARRLWPAGNLPVEKAGWFCEMFTAAVPNNRTILYFSPEIAVEGDTVRVGGATNAAPMRETMAGALRAAGVSDVRNEMRLLPEEGRLEGKRFGVCVAATARTYETPSELARPQSQLLCGEPVYLLDYDAAADYYLLHGADGYWGWARADGIRVLSAEEHREYAAGLPAILLREIEAGGRRCLRGALVSVTPGDADTRSIQSAGGARVRIEARDAFVWDDPAAGVAAAERALELLYCPYVFGGVSPLGLDCSGLVRWAWSQSGVYTARDASQQFLLGRLAATRWERGGIRTGDLLYFVDACGRIHHTAIALNETHFVHSMSPTVQINSLREGDRLYDARRAETFFAAKRIIHNC